jgi:DNA-binding beta-propeller fold protein YncE
MSTFNRTRPLLAISTLLCAFLAGGAVRIVQDTCGPFTDVSAMLCPYVLEAYFTGITAGTSATTFSPDTPITRGQAAVFTTKGLNQALARGSRRAALGQWWSDDAGPRESLALTSVGASPNKLASDGSDVWVVNQGDGTVSRIHASDGRLLETWTGATGAEAVLVAMGRVFVAGGAEQGRLYMIDPSMPAGAVVTVSSTLGPTPFALAFDGSRIWATDNAGPMSIVTPGATLPWATTTFTVPGTLDPSGIVFDGSNIWITDTSAPSLLRLDASGNVLQNVPLHDVAGDFTFDGTNLWIPLTTSIAVVRASSGEVVATLTGNGLAGPEGIAFDGQRILVANTLGDSVSVWNAATLSPLGTFGLGTGISARGVCSDGVNFWITLGATGQLARF